MELNLSEYVKHPDRLNGETLDVLRRLVDDYPYFQPARLLCLRNLYLLHHADFDRELRTAALFLPDRNALFQLIEGLNYRLEPERRHQLVSERPETEDRTGSLIDTFLAGIPEEKPRRPVPADASTDYIAYMMQAGGVPESTIVVPPMQHQTLIDNFIEQGRGRTILPELPDESLQTPELPDETQSGENSDYFTETLARIYIKQGRYTKALEIIRSLSLKYPKKKSLLCRSNTFFGETDNK